MKKRKLKKQGNKDADLDKDLESYDVENSDDNLDTEDRILLNNARGRRKFLEEEEEVLAVNESSSESENDDEYIVEVEEQSDVGDISGEEQTEDSDSDEHQNDGLPDSKAWGTKTKNYYNTDYVDKDYSGFDDEEAAVMEEQEAKTIQQRLLGQLDGSDFTFGLLEQVEEKKKEVLLKAVKLDIEEKVKVDRTKLDEQELKEFDETETPGFNKIMEDCKKYLKYAKKVIEPTINFAQASKMKDCPALNLLKTKEYLIWRYCLNLYFLLLLKAKRTVSVDRHPINNSLNQITNYLKNVDSLENDELKSQMIQIADLLKQKKNQCKKKMTLDYSVKEIEGLASCKNRKERRKLLQLLAEKDRTFQNSNRYVKFADEVDGKPLEIYAQELKEQSKVTNEDDYEEAMVDGSDKRAITYQMLKNKGLTPKRKKEVRNPRVRNKNKYKKAVIRRKGQVKVARKELRKYDGEIAGIKKNLSKSVKLI